MNFQRFYKTDIAILVLLLCGISTICPAQTPAPRPTSTIMDEKESRPKPLATGNNLYCAGYVETTPVNTSYEIIGAQEEKDRHIFAQGDFVYVNVGANRGARVGDVYSVIRPRGRVETRWTDKKNLGFFVQEVGAVEIISVGSEASAARVKMSCDNLLIGDLLQPTPNRVSPISMQRPALDLFAVSTGRSSGRIFMARDSQELLGRENIVYIDLGAEDNVKIGDYLTIYRPLGTGNIIDKIPGESVSARDEGFQSKEYRGGKFSNQAQRKSGETARGKVVTTNDVKNRRPNLRRVLGEMVILNVKQKTATAMITRSASEIHTGDMVELQ